MDYTDYRFPDKLIVVNHNHSCFNLVGTVEGYSSYDNTVYILFRNARANGNVGAYDCWIKFKDVEVSP